MACRPWWGDPQYLVAMKDEMRVAIEGVNEIVIVDGSLTGCDSSSVAKNHRRHGHHHHRHADC